MHPDHLSKEDFLRELRARGARRLVAVAFRANRSTIWSLTRDATVLNVHEAYRTASDSILEAFATIAAHRAERGDEVDRARCTVERWPPLGAAIAALREDREPSSRGATGNGSTAAPCSGTAEQRAYLRALYRYFNETRFGGALPADIPVRLSDRMTSALGHMLPGVDRDGRPRVAEIALSVDLMLPGNGPERVDTLLHEMAHAADYLFDGNRGHGASWRRWAGRVGCRPQTLFDRPVERRTTRGERVTRVPPLPVALATRAIREPYSAPAY